MSSEPTVYVLGAGAIGLPLAAHLAHAGRRVLAVRTRRPDAPREVVRVTVDGPEPMVADVETVALAELPRLEGVVAVTAKAHANRAIAPQLRPKIGENPVVLLQNGVGVERPFLEAGFPAVYRCVLYVTSQAVGPNAYTTRPIASSPVGAVAGDAAGLEDCLKRLSTPGLPFHAEPGIEREVWKKALINTVFNSVCPLLEADNGVFARSAEAERLARELVGECLTLTERLGLDLTEGEIMAQLLRISRGSDGQLISTLQDLRAGRPTEIEFLNLEIARLAASQQPPLWLPRVELLGRMVLMKSRQRSDQS